jgi:hypothetical protein
VVDDELLELVEVEVDELLVLDELEDELVLLELVVVDELEVVVDEELKLSPPKWGCQSASSS